MKLPKSIVTETNDTYLISEFKDGAFILKENPYFYSYVIESNDFTKLVNGLIVSAGIKAKEHNSYVEWVE